MEGFSIRYWQVVNVADEREQGVRRHAGGKCIIDADLCPSIRQHQNAHHRAALFHQMPPQCLERVLYFGLACYIVVEGQNHRSTAPGDPVEVFKWMRCPIIATTAPAPHAVEVHGHNL